MRSLLLKFLAVAKVLVKLTATTTDDEVIAILEMIAQEPAIINWLETTILPADAGGILTVAAIQQPPAAVREAVARRNIDWAKLLKNFAAIVSIFKTITFSSAGTAEPQFASFSMEPAAVDATAAALNAGSAQAESGNGEQTA